MKKKRREEERKNALEVVEKETAKDQSPKGIVSETGSKVVDGYKLVENMMENHVPNNQVKKQNHIVAILTIERKCLKKKKKEELEKKEKNDPNPNRRGKAKNVSQKRKKRKNEAMQMSTEEIRTIILEELQNVLDEKKEKKEFAKRKLKRKKANEMRVTTRLKGVIKFGPLHMLLAL